MKSQSVEDRINDLLDAFSRAATGLFDITGRYHSTFEQGVYGCAIAKPTKRMRSALGVDREILVVASTFADQQQRTIRFIQREILDSAGRYENTIAIAIHNDAEGNSKLKNWGRDQGISILPVYDASKYEEPGDLERALCFELYSHDPFDVTGPVSDDANFYGRRDEAIDLARKLQKGQIRSCLGIRKIGKTSIINRILKEIRGNYRCACLMIDCSRDDVWELSAAQLLNSMRESISASLASPDGYASISPNTANLDIRVARDALQKVVTESEHPILLVLDEIDYITPGSPTNSAWAVNFNLYWRNLRSIYQECDRQGRAMSILVGGVSTHWFTVESIGGIENAALSFVPEEYLSPMPEGATVAMLRRLGRIAGLQIDDSAAALIASATGNMPYWARKCCSYVHRHIPVSERPCPVGADRVNPLVDAFVAEEGASIAEVALRHLFRVHPQLQDAVRRCRIGEAHLVAESLRRTLRRYGVLTAQGDLSGAMITRAFDSLASDSASASPQSIGEAVATANYGTSLGEWAEELAALGKRRNLLERRLRDFVINFIRFDALSKGRQPEARERIAAALPEKQRNALRHLNIEELIAKFLWTDLIQLLLKEWSLFERLLGDKEKFSRNAEIINDRFDAHAKSADTADFALYRRALAHIEDQISKLQ